MHASTPAADRGANLVEVMMASAILMAGFVGVIQAVTISSESLDTARKQQVAQQMITAEIEKLRGGAWTTIASLPASATIAINSAGVASGDATSFFLTNYSAASADDNAEFCALARGFTCSLTRTYLRPTSASAATATFIKVTYTATWTTNTGHVQRHQMDAYLAKNGLHFSHQQS
jgi:hypothetical protein